MYEAVDNSQERVEAIYLLKEGFGVCIVLIEVEGGEDIDEELIEINTAQHVLFGECVEVVVDGFALLEQDALEEDVAVVVGVEFLNDGAALSVQTHPFLNHVLQLLSPQRLERHLNRHILFHHVLQK